MRINKALFFGILGAALGAQGCSQAAEHPHRGRGLGSGDNFGHAGAT
jgi:hypothetical protein